MVGLFSNFHLLTLPLFGLCSVFSAERCRGKKEEKEVRESNEENDITRGAGLAKEVTSSSSSGDSNVVNEDGDDGEWITPDNIDEHKRKLRRRERGKK